MNRTPNFGRPTPSSARPPSIRRLAMPSSPALPTAARVNGDFPSPRLSATRRPSRHLPTAVAAPIASRHEPKQRRIPL